MTADFNWLIAATIAVAYCSIDWLFTIYTLSIVKRRPLIAANVGVGLYILSAFGVINYVSDWRYVIPMCIGGWIGTFFSVSRERNKDDLEDEDL